MSGSYAEYAVISASRLVKLPDGLGSTMDAASMLQGMTAHFLSHSTYPLKAGETALIHAAAGGVGLLLVQMAKRRSARVIGTVSTRAKADVAKEAGADEIILYTQQDFEAEVKRMTNGRGVDVVYDSVGRTTFDKSINCLAPRGYMVLFGQSSGFVPRLNPMHLASKGSLFFTRPRLEDYTLSRKELVERARDVFDWVQSGELKVRVDRTFLLREARAAHSRLEKRLTTGKLILIP
jgi:NADPH2:quinone reductase